MLMILEIVYMEIKVNIHKDLGPMIPIGRQSKIEHSGLTWANLTRAKRS